ncbi:hypothetical protein L484_004701 [Morus notabilis]|uniref:Uncharacterized protein n=1 Tax=Morus notabilis TaxID=981085 RepID=W9S9J4_9ROSA|nr:hypothetical protein L484_004701 [Morus notabilis]
MAELILSPIAGKILEGLGSADVKEIALFWGVNDDLDQLNETISTIKSVLLDAEEKQINSHQVRNWLRRLGGVVDDADNLMDEFNTEALRQRVMPAGSETVKHTLRLNGCSGLRELPRDMKKLVNLRHLEIDRCSGLTHMPRGLSQLTNLQTLSTYILSESNDVVMINGGELKELVCLNNLKGELEILNLGHENDTARDYESANLKEKQYLRYLALKWISDDEGTEAPVGYEKSLDALQPHLNLQELALWNYGGVKISSWLSSLTNMVNLTLQSCEKCQHLVPLNQFPRLEKLELNFLPCLEYINGEEEDLLLSSTIVLPSLRELRLRDLPNLKGWWREVVSGELLPCFPPCLSTLEIRNCPQLSCMPLYPHLEGRLDLINTRLKPLEQTVLVLESRKCSTSTTGTEIPTTPSSSFSSLSKLTSLTISEIGEDLQCLPEWFKSLTCLKKLEIQECSKLKDLSPGIQHLTSLEDLEIRNCEELEVMIPLKNNGRLRYLRLIGSHKLASLPGGLQHLTSLRRLLISDWESLETIPEWIGNLNSLESLHLLNCPKLRALPEGIRSLTCLKTLWIWDCPMLLKRCQRQIGEDWPKIAHIPDLSLR